MGATAGVAGGAVFALGIDLLSGIVYVGKFFFISEKKIQRKRKRKRERERVCVCV